MAVRDEITNPSRMFMGRTNDGMKGHSVFELGRAEDVIGVFAYMCNLYLKKMEGS